MPRVRGGPAHARKRKRVLKRASGFRAGPGTLYRVMRELRHEGLITRTDPAEAPGDERQVHHALTPLGQAVLRAELGRLQRTILLAGAVDSRRAVK